MINPPTKFRCPACGGVDVRPSHPKNLLDSFLKSFRKLPFRCRGCSHRFYRHVPVQEEEAASGEEAGSRRAG